MRFNYNNFKIHSIRSYLDACSSSDEEPDEDDVIMIRLLALVKCRRSPIVYRNRLIWDEHVKLLLEEDQFTSMYRMTYPTLKKLLDLLSPFLQVDASQANRRCKGGGCITPELILHCLLRYLAGGSFHDIRTKAGIAKSTFFSCLHRGIDAVNRCDELAIKFPMERDALNKVALEFQKKSSSGMMDGCVGAIDGWLCQIKVPSASDTANIASYFSGHYQCYGINVQAACDARCRFTYLSVRSPGGTGDSRSFHGSSLKEFLDILPRGFYLVGDSAYTLSSSLLIPYSGADKKRKDNDIFNFHLSQLRIKIEQAFGLLVNKWRVFKRPIEIKLKRVPSLIECCMRLHNWCINERDGQWIVPDMTPGQLDEHVASYEEYMDDADPTSANARGGGRGNIRSMVRNAITKQLVSEGRDRPRHNRMRNN
jgi:hypothetical protein